LGPCGGITRKKDHGEIVIYQRPKSPKWQTRIKVAGSNGYVRKPTRTNDETNALNFAENLYENLVEKYKATGSTISKSFKKVANEWLKSLKEQGRDKALLNNFTECIERYAVKFWDNKSIDSIKNSDLADFIQWRRTHCCPTYANLNENVI